MKRALTNTILIIAALCLCTFMAACAEEAPEVSVDVTETDKPAESGVDPAESGVNPTAGGNEQSAGDAEPEADGDAAVAVEITPPPTPTPTPSPTQKIVRTPAPTPVPTPTPVKTPEYTTLEFDKYVDGYVAGGEVNMRSGPGTKYDIIGEYERFDYVLVTGECEEWYRVKVDGLRGYMLRELVVIGKYTTPKPTNKPTSKPSSTPSPSGTASQKPTAPPVYAGDTGSYTEDELMLVSRIVQREAGSSSDGCLAVANAILNRVASSRFPNTVSGVIFQKGQFTTADGSDVTSITPKSTAINAVSSIFVQGERVLPENVLYFRAQRASKTWGSRTFYATVGGNDFFS